jgi:hypothetical protein
MAGAMIEVEEGKECWAWQAAFKGEDAVAEQSDVHTVLCVFDCPRAWSFALVFFLRACAD